MEGVDAEDDHCVSLMYISSGSFTLSNPAVGNVSNGVAILAKHICQTGKRLRLSAFVRPVEVVFEYRPIVMFFSPETDRPKICTDRIISI